MRHTFINAVVCTMQINDKIVTPMIGYIIRNNDTNEIMSCSRKEAYDLISEHGATNVEPKSRINEAGEICYYLKLKDNNFKINQFLIDYTSNQYLQTEEYLESIIKTKKTYGYIN